MLEATEQIAFVWFGLSGPSLYHQIEMIACHWSSTHIVKYVWNNIVIEMTFQPKTEPNRTKCAGPKIRFHWCNDRPTDQPSKYTKWLIFALELQISFIIFILSRIKIRSFINFSFRQKFKYSKLFRRRKKKRTLKSVQSVHDISHFLCALVNPFSKHTQNYNRMRDDVCMYGRFNNHHLKCCI